MPTSTPALFPSDPDAEVLARAGGDAGTYVVWKLKTCRYHFHYAFSICGVKEPDAVFNFPSVNLMQDEALGLCLAMINAEVQRQTKDESDGQLKH